jgi:hypothetical protein
MDTPRPGNFPIGSPESRAAARMLMGSRRDNRKRIQFVTNVSFPDHDGPPGDRSKLYVTPWTETQDGCLFRFVYVPNGTDDETEERLVATP